MAGVAYFVELEQQPVLDQVLGGALAEVVESSESMRRHVFGAVHTSEWRTPDGGQTRVSEDEIADQVEAEFVQRRTGEIDAIADVLSPSADVGRGWLSKGWPRCAPRCVRVTSRR